jgi:hypothetical protein
VKEKTEFDNDGMEGLPIADIQDNQILMHRDVHFGGKFDVMVDYYVNEGKGVHPDFDLERIVTLAKIEKEMKTDLAPMMLSGVDAEKIAEAKTAYKKLREVYSRKPDIKNARLIADLILTENLDPQEEIEAIVQEKATIVPSLITLLKSEEYYDPLFPGYGMAPSLAAKCLGLIGDKRAIISLFEAMREGDFFDEDEALNALRTIGTPAKEFLLKVVQGKPYNEDNEKAAVALIAFKNDEEVSKVCLELLKDPLVLKDIPLATYLILACEGLKEPADRKAFEDIGKDAAASKTFSLDIKAVASNWES